MLHPGTPRLSPAPVDGASCVVVGTSWESQWSVSWAPSPRDLCKAGARPSQEGGEALAVQGSAVAARQLLQSPKPTAVTAAGLFTSSCAGLHLNPPSCLISKANSFSDKSMICGCSDQLFHCSVSQRGRGCRQDLDWRTPVDVMLGERGPAKAIEENSLTTSRPLLFRG
ncbi:hypothetical protein VULLAG_LOCUS10864 [Vulpes lagopus]